MEGDREDGRFPVLVCGFRKEWAGLKRISRYRQELAYSRFDSLGGRKPGTVLRAVPPEVSQDHP